MHVTTQAKVQEWAEQRKRELGDVLTRRDISEMYRVNPSTLKEWLRRPRHGMPLFPKALVAGGPGGCAFWRREDVEAWMALKDLKAQEPPPPREPRVSKPRVRDRSKPRSAPVAAAVTGERCAPFRPLPARDGVNSGMPFVRFEVDHDRVRARAFEGIVCESAIYKSKTPAAMRETG